MKIFQACIGLVSAGAWMAPTPPDCNVPMNEMNKYDSYDDMQ